MHNIVFTDDNIVFTINIQLHTYYFIGSILFTAQFVHCAYQGFCLGFQAAYISHISESGKPDIVWVNFCHYAFLLAYAFDSFHTTTLFPLSSGQ